MATLQKRIDRTRLDNWVDAVQYTADRAIEDANIIIHQIEDYITSSIWEWFFWDIMYSDTTVVDQSEYRIPKISSWSFIWTPKIESISVCYRDWWDYIPATLVNREILLQKHDLSWYETNQSEADPIYFIADDSYFIYPAPLEAVTTWIKYYWIKSLWDVLATTDEDDLFGWKIPKKYYNMISEWMEQFVFKIQWKRMEAKESRNYFENTILPWLVEKLGNRKVWIENRGELNTSSLLL